MALPIEDTVAHPGAVVSPRSAGSRLLPPGTPALSGRPSGGRNDLVSHCHCEERSDEAIPEPYVGFGPLEPEAMPDAPSPFRGPPLPQSFDDPLGRKIIELYVWAVGEGLRGTEAAPLFDGLCQRLVIAGVPLWRAFAGMRTLHPQWGGYGYTWWRRLNAIQPQQFERGEEYEQGIFNSPFGHLRRQANEQGDGRGPLLHLRRQLVGSEAQLDFPPLKDLAAAGA